MIVRVGFLSLALLALAAAGPATISEAKDTVSRRAYDRQIGLLEQAFESHSQDEAQLRSLYTRDAVLVEADGNEIRGRNRIVPAFRKVLASGAVVHFRVNTTTVRADGDCIYAGGTEDIDERAGSGLRHARNRFLLVMRHETDGGWRFDYVMEART
jgi:uncharacterized protein (TIGR02246 family)